ncbi:MAG: polyphosphate:AMP phosphotransferase [Coriobacteriales bacterium]|nr:polyphosphate:AMP phosphotransferase [Coriobacteriales bacterium]
MLKGFARANKPEKAEIKQRTKEEQAKLAVNQLRIKEAKVPVMVIFEGWGASGKGTTIARVIKDMDPRFFSVACMDGEPTDEEMRRPFLWRYMVEIPEQGKFKFFDTCWMEEVTHERVKGELSRAAYEQRIDSINMIERQLVDNGYLVMKFFFQVGQKEQRQRIDALRTSENTSWRVTEEDLWENEHYEKCLDVYDRYLRDTNRSSTPWYIIDARNSAWASLQVLEFINSGVDVAIHNRNVAAPLRQNVFPLRRTTPLAEIPLDKTIDDDAYSTELKALQAHLRSLHNTLYRKRIPVVIAYEGWDAAGKGGNIKRLTAALDPRGYIVHPIAAPEPRELARHYLWRFWNRLPKSGHIAIFDRTWYGRVMVERLEGFCSENDWRRAYNEINEFEKELVDSGTVVIKFWVQIDSDTQLARFTDRQNTPEKQWKITEEDWRNREKWDLYEQATNEMIAKTNTTFAPWHILESVDKHYARIKALRIVIDTLEAACAD